MREPKLTAKESLATPDTTAKKMFEFKEGEIAGEWLEIQNKEGKKVEGKLFSPTESEGNGKIALFFPGLPGDSVVWFENKFVPKLVKDGFTVFCARHNGLIPSEQNNKYVNCTERQTQSDQPIGNLGRQTTTDDWLNEPAVAIEHFAHKFDGIKLIAHSFSGISSAVSLCDLLDKYPEAEKSPVAKIDTWTILSGFTADLREGDYWDPNRQFFNFDLMRKFFTDIRGNVFDSVDAETMLKQFVDAFIKVKAKIKGLPRSVGVIGVYPEKDRMVSYQSGLDLQANIGRGLIIVDETFDETAFPEGTDAHDFPHMNPGYLLSLIGK